MKYKIALLLTLFTSTSFAQNSLVWDITGRVKNQIVFKNNFYSPKTLEEVPFLAHSFSEEGMSTVEESSAQKKEAHFNKYEISSMQEQKLRVTTFTAVNVYLGVAVMNKTAMAVKGDERKVTFVHSCNSEESIIVIDNLELTVKCKETRR